MWILQEYRFYLILAVLALAAIVTLMFSLSAKQTLVDYNTNFAADYAVMKSKGLPFARAVTVDGTTLKGLEKGMFAKTAPDIEKVLYLDNFTKDSASELTLPYAEKGKFDLYFVTSESFSDGDSSAIDQKKVGSLLDYEGEDTISKGTTLEKDGARLFVFEDEPTTRLIMDEYLPEATLIDLAGETKAVLTDFSNGAKSNLVASWGKDNATADSSEEEASESKLLAIFEPGQHLNGHTITDPRLVGAKMFRMSYINEETGEWTKVTIPEVQYAIKVKDDWVAWESPKLWISMELHGETMAIDRDLLSDTLTFEFLETDASKTLYLYISDSLEEKSNDVKSNNPEHVVSIEGGAKTILQKITSPALVGRNLILYSFQDITTGEWEEGARDYTLTVYNSEEDANAEINGTPLTVGSYQTPISISGKDINSDTIWIKGKTDTSSELLIYSFPSEGP